MRIATALSKSKGKAKASQAKIEYSGREVSPHSLLLRQVLDAHSIFLLHHGSSLAEMYKRLKRSKFCAALDRFWNKFLRNWDVLLHGSPAVDMFPGLKLAAGGELGIGVGEEEWGSGEREVLEDFTRRTSGLIDVVVSRFGVDSTINKDDSPQNWLGAGLLPTSTDGIIYPGTGKVVKKSLVAISKWMEWMYKQGASTYGVQDNPHAPKRKRRKENTKLQYQGLDAWPKGIPSPLITTANKSLEVATAKAAADHQDVSTEASTSSSTGTDVLMKYMTFGIYGSGWGLPSKSPTPTKPADGTPTGQNESKQKSHTENAGALSAQRSAISHSPEPTPSFLIGFRGNLRDESADATEDDFDDNDDGVTAPKSSNNRISLRTLYVEMDMTSETNDATTTSTKTDRVQVIVYINQPFVFTFLFELNTPTLGYASFYRSIDHQLGPLRKPLLKSTALETLQNRFSNTLSLRTITSVDSKQPIYDLIYDPVNCTIHSTIPSIPDVHNLKAEWSRLDALNVHSQILHTHLITKQSLSASERTAKTARNWWVVWIKFPPGEHWQSKEAFLVRKASDYIEDGSRKSSIGFAKDLANLGSSAGRVAEGIGIDARRYVEGLITMSR